MTTLQKTEQNAATAEPQVLEFTPAVDIYEKPDAVLIVADLPGVEKKDIDLQVEDDVLTLTAMQTTGTPPGHRVLVSGYETGRFRRSFSLGDDIDRDRVKAELRNGVLHLVLPKLAKAKARRIEVKTD